MNSFKDGLYHAQLNKDSEIMVWKYRDRFFTLGFPTSIRHPSSFFWIGERINANQSPLKTK